MPCFKPPQSNARPHQGRPHHARPNDANPNHDCPDHQQCRQSALDAAEEYCRKKGVRWTDLRRRILGLIWESHQPVKAYDLMAKLSSAGTPPAKPPIVYRTLDFLRRHGLIHRLDSLNAYVGCGHPNHHKDCYFLLCTECGRADECCASDLASAIHNASTSHGFDVMATTLEMTGTCARCKDDNHDRPA